MELSLGRFSNRPQIGQSSVKEDSYIGSQITSLRPAANPWTDWRFLPVSLRMSKPLVVGNIVSGLIFVAVGMKALWDYGQVSSYLILAAFLVCSIILASQLKFLQRKRPNTPSPSIT